MGPLLNCCGEARSWQLLDAYGVFVETVEGRIGTSPATPQAINSMLGLHLNLVVISQALRSYPVLAIRVAKRSLDIAKRLAALDAKDQMARSRLVDSYLALGSARAASKQFTEAIQDYHDALAIAEEQAAADPSNNALTTTVAACHDSIGQTLRRSGNPAAAAAEHRKSVELLMALTAPRPEDPRLHLLLGQTQGQLGDAYLALAQSSRGSPAEVRYWRDARAAFVQALALYERPDNPMRQSPTYGSLKDGIADSIRRCDENLSTVAPH